MDERVAFLNTEFATTGLLTKQQLMDAIAATVAIFLPSFLLVALLQPLMKRMRHSATFASFLGAVNVASVAIIASICFTMGKESIAEWHTIINGSLQQYSRFQIQNSK